MPVITSSKIVLLLTPVIPVLEHNEAVTGSSYNL